MADVVGAVGLTVQPETSGFRAKVEAAVKAALRGVNVNLPPVDADFGKVKEKAKTAAESVQRSFKDASKDSDAALNNVGGSATFLRARESAKSASDSVHRSFKESAEKSDHDLGKVGDSNPFASLIRQAFALAIALSSVQALLTAGKFTAIIPGILGAASAAISLVGALGPITGLLGALPGAILLGATAFGVFKLAARGVGDALKAYSEQTKNTVANTKAQAQAVESATLSYQSAQARVVAANEQIVLSERTLMHAQENNVIAQQNLTRARKEAADEIESMRLALIGATLSEERAQINLQEAIKNEAAIREQAAQTGVVDAIALHSANLAVREAELGVQQAVDAKTLTQQKANEVNAKGIEGSTQVVAANQALVSSQEALSDANRGVIASNKELTLAIAALGREARALETAKNPVNKFQEAMDQLTPAARALVNTLITFQAPLKHLSEVAAQGLFPGVEAGLNSIRPLFDRLEPIIRSTAEALGNFVRRLGELLGSKAFSSDLVTIGNANVSVIKTLTDAFIKILPVFTDIAVAAIPLVQGLADLANTWAGNIAGAASLGRETGSLTAFFSNALVVFKDVFEILKNLFSGLLTIFSAAAPEGRVFLDILVQATAKFAVFMKTLKDNGTLGTIFGTLRKVITDTYNDFKTFFPVIKELFDALVPAIGPVLDVVRALVIPLFANKQTFQAFVPIIRSLTPLISQLATIIRALSTGFDQILIAVLPLIPILAGALLDVIGTLVRVLLPPLVSLFVKLTPVIAAVAKTIAQGLAEALVKITPVLVLVAEKLAAGLLDALTRLVPVLPVLADAFGRILVALIPLIPVFVDLALALLSPKVIDALVVAIEAFAKVLVLISPILPEIVGAILALMAISSVVEVIAGLAGAFEVLGAIIGVILSPVGLVVIAIAAVALGIYLAYQKFQPFHDAVDAVGRALRDAFGASLEFIRDLLPKVVTGFDKFNEIIHDIGDWMEKHLGPIVVELKNLFVALIPVFQIIFGLVKTTVISTFLVLRGVFEIFVNIVTTLWRNFGDNIIRFVEIAFNYIKGVIEAALRIILGIIQIFTGILTGDWGKVWEGIKNVVGGALDGILNTVKTVFELIILTIQSAFDLVLSIFQIFWSTIKTVVTTGWDIIKNIFQGAIDAIVAIFQFLYDIVVGHSIIPDLINAIFDWVKHLPGKILDLIKDFVSRSVDAFLNLKDRAVGVVRNLVGDVLGFITSMPDKILEVIPKMLDAGSRLIGGLFDGIRNVLGHVVGLGKSVANAIIGIVNRDVIDKINDTLSFSFHGVSISSPDLPHIPELAGQGVIVTKATNLIVGEAGKEVVLPLTNAKRTLELAQQSGLFDVLAKATASTQQNFNPVSSLQTGAHKAPGPGVVFGPGAIVVQFSGSVTPDEARMVGQQLGRGIESIMASQEAQVEAGAY